ncbi:cell wall elongation regulator TseB-like domain-containing protein [Levilactobacillus namurensis]|nr:DUF5590 domain-containing protein [Levilactobacillus namurensis]PTM23913.1 hypothetical protein DA798_03155 [Lactobacillus sp. PFC-70]MCW3777515.1 DUF5590 domain-containing protein [Levilactobacillus namurensis]MDT7018715.1 DUF5590 domain-containing protein [Levilactobacillus namurensis]WNN66739.1 DUF5590 domain-containing protein [Levilactobacillus namurensis]HJE44830.1 DUF5590 domain-containing protein [Levilactobacillus namurensis]
MRQQYQRRRRPRHWGLLTVLVVVLVLLLSGGYVIQRATRPFNQAQTRAERIAKKSGKLTKTTDFYWTNLDTTYYTVAGQNKAKQNVYAVIPKTGKNVTVLKQSAGLSRNAVLQRVWQRNPKKVLSAALSIFNGKPAWQVSYLSRNGKLCYLTFQYSNGKVLQQIANI